MAAGDTTLYNGGHYALTRGEVDFASDTIKMALVTGYTPDIDADAYWSDISANEESGTGYTAGGEALANKSVTQDNTNDRTVFDADDVTWNSLDVGTPSHAVIYKDTGTPSTSRLLWAIELGTASVGTNYSVRFSANGALRIAKKTA